MKTDGYYENIFKNEKFNYIIKTDNSVILTDFNLVKLN
jgi:hypothetical protein